MYHSLILTISVFLQYVRSSISTVVQIRNSTSLSSGSVLGGLKIGRAVSRRVRNFETGESSSRNSGTDKLTLKARDCAVARTFNVSAAAKSCVLGEEGSFGGLAFSVGGLSGDLIFTTISTLSGQGGFLDFRMSCLYRHIDLCKKH
jgi:hypothetical protein